MIELDNPLDSEELDYAILRFRSSFLVCFGIAAQRRSKIFKVDTYRAGELIQTATVSAAARYFITENPQLDLRGCWLLVTEHNSH